MRRLERLAGAYSRLPPKQDLNSLPASNYRPPSAEELLRPFPRGNQFQQPQHKLDPRTTLYGQALNDSRDATLMNNDSLNEINGLYGQVWLKLQGLTPKLRNGSPPSSPCKQLSKDNVISGDTPTQANRSVQPVVYRPLSQSSATPPWADLHAPPNAVAPPVLRQQHSAASPGKTITRNTRQPASLVDSEAQFMDGALCLWVNPALPATPNATPKHAPHLLQLKMTFALSLVHHTDPIRTHFLISISAIEATGLNNALSLFTPHYSPAFQYVVRIAPFNARNTNTWHCPLIKFTQPIKCANAADPMFAKPLPPSSALPPLESMNLAQRLIALTWNHRVLQVNRPSINNNNPQHYTKTLPPGLAYNKTPQDKRSMTHSPKHAISSPPKPSLCHAEGVDRFRQHRNSTKLAQREQPQERDSFTAWLWVACWTNILNKLALMPRSQQIFSPPCLEGPANPSVFLSGHEESLPNPRLFSPSTRQTDEEKPAIAEIPLDHPWDFERFIREAFPKILNRSGFIKNENEFRPERYSFDKAQNTAHYTLNNRQPPAIQYQPKSKTLKATGFGGSDNNLKAMLVLFAEKAAQLDSENKAPQTWRIRLSKEAAATQPEINHCLKKFNIDLKGKIQLITQLEQSPSPQHTHVTP